MANNIPPDNAPSEDKLMLLIANGASDVAQQLIDTFKMPFIIKDGTLKASVVGAEVWLNRFITEDADTVLMKEDAKKLAITCDEVLIMGETGTGKEIIARAMIGDRQENSKDAKFIAVNCAGLPETLIESELFGYVKGSFTGAESTREGMMAKANDGVVFLDEIGELPMSMQGKLLRALQERVVRKVGGSTEDKIACKFVCATNKNLKQMMVQGLFRQDLYARISTFELIIKPLRDRDCDIVPIIKSFKGGDGFLSALSAAGRPAIKLDTTFNVRSLQQYVKRWNVLNKLILTT